MSDAEVLGARAAYLPDLALNFNYGIDAAQFATKGPNGVNNLGYSASATLDIPVWDWLATPHRVKQTEIRRNATRVALTATQRHLIAALDEAYAEAAEARAAGDIAGVERADRGGESAADEAALHGGRSDGAGGGGRASGADRWRRMRARMAWCGMRHGLANLQTLTGTL